MSNRYGECAKCGGNLTTSHICPSHITMQGQETKLPLFETEADKRIAELEQQLLTSFENGVKEGMERAADMLDLNYPLCAKWIRKEIT